MKNPLINLLLILSLVWPHQLFAVDGVQQDYDPDSIFASDEFAKIDTNDFQATYTMVYGGYQLIVRLKKVIPYPASSDGKLRVFKVLQETKVDPNTLKDAPAIVKNPPSFEVPGSQGAQVGEGSSSGGSSSGGQGHGSEGSGTGWSDTAQAGMLIVGAGQAFQAGVNFSMGIANQLRNQHKANLGITRQYGVALNQTAQKVEKASSAYNNATGYVAGTRSGQVPTNKTEAYNKDVVSESSTECLVDINDGTFFNMPKEFQQAYLNGNMEVVSKYTELLLSGESVSDFCKSHLGTLTSPNKLISIQVTRPELDESPFEKYNFSSPLNLHEGTLIRKLANKYQVEWAHSHAMDNMTPEEQQSYLTGVGYLKAADHSLARGDFQQSYTQVKTSEILLNIAQGFKDGLLEATDELVKTAPIIAKNLKDLVISGLNDPEYVVEATQRLINNIPEVYKAIKKDLIKNYEVIQNGSAYERSVLAGKIAFDAGVGFITGGTVKIATKGVNVLNNVVKKTKIAQTAKRIKQSLPKLNYDHHIRGRTLAKEIDINSDLVAKQAQRLKNVDIELRSTGIQLSDNAKDFLAGQIVNERDILGKAKSFSQTKLNAIAKKYNQFEKAFPELETSAVNTRLMRGVPKSLKLPNNVIAETTKENVFDFHRYTYTASGRYTMPGDVGLYTTIGDKIEDAGKTIMLEMGEKSLKNIQLGTAKVTSDKILDLSSSTVGRANLDKLGIQLNDLTKVENYTTTHSLGHLARKNGFDGLIFDSAKRAGSKNLVIF